jgi:hypothetical protein
MSSKLSAKLAILAVAPSAALKILHHPAAATPFERSGSAVELTLLALCLIPRTTLPGAALFTLYLVAATAAGTLTRLDFVLDLALIPVIWLGPGLRNLSSP